MALKSSKKRIRQNEKRRERNRRYLSSSRTLVKKAKIAIADGNLEQAKEATILATQSLDKAAAKGVIHKNNASRRKSRLMKSLVALEKAA
ncbi:MAG: 30S ribosomal protein S20 [Chloroflexota bacterium]|nr:MAG: 30S ribosomal protein S20 [Anaerolineaceae bacterium 4572_5.2]RLD10117.1 MAG: 30S ribosomal protein S20 [Chloroflexota bacterium]